MNILNPPLYKQVTKCGGAQEFSPCMRKIFAKKPGCWQPPCISNEAVLWKNFLTILTTNHYADTSLLFNNMLINAPRRNRCISRYPVKLMDGIKRQEDKEPGLIVRRVRKDFECTDGSAIYMGGKKNDFYSKKIFSSMAPNRVT